MNVLNLQFLDALAWTLIHFLWQGLVIGLAAAGILRIMRQARPQTRYTVALVAFLTCLIVPFATFAYLWLRYSGQAGILLAGDAALSGAMGLMGEAQYPPWLLKLLPDLPVILVAAWSAGVVLGGLKLFAGFLGVQWVRRHGVEPVPARLQRLFDELCDEFELSGRVALRLSHRILSPMTVGWLRPLVLVPASAWLGLRQDELRLILAHELAHIRRWDYLINLLQQMTVTFLFYHPVVHWLSRVLSEEREMCCDEMVVRGSEDKRLLYAKALLHLQEQHGHMMSLVMSARGGAFLRRVYRLLTKQDQEEAPRTALNGLVGLLMVGLVNTVFMLHANEAVANFSLNALAYQSNTATLHVVRANPLDAVQAEVRNAWERALQRRIETSDRIAGQAAGRGGGDALPQREAADKGPAVQAAGDDVLSLGRISALPASTVDAARQLARRALGAERGQRENFERPLSGLFNGSQSIARPEGLAVEELTVFNLDKITVHEPAGAGSSGVTPRLVRMVHPQYPLSARYNGAAGDVRLVYHLNPDGTISDIQHDPSSSGNPALVKAAVRALEDWVYEPFQYDRPLVMAQTFRFVSQEEPDDEACFSRLKDTCGWNKRAVDSIKVNDDSGETTPRDRERSQTRHT